VLIVRFGKVSGKGCAQEKSDHNHSEWKAKSLETIAHVFDLPNPILWAQDPCIQSPPMLSTLLIALSISKYKTIGYKI